MSYKIEELHKSLLAYGNMLYDLEYEESDGFGRIRIFEINGHRYVHRMFNGELVELVEL